MEETISLTVCFFTLKLVRALYSLILLIFVLHLIVLVTNIEIPYQIYVKMVNLLNHVW